MALTKTFVSVDAWALLTQNTIREGATIDVSDAYTSTLSVYVAIVSGISHGGTKIQVQVSSNTSGDEDWSSLATIRVPGFSATIATFLAPTLVEGQVQAAVASTSGFEDDEARWIFLRDLDDTANSEPLYLISTDPGTSIQWKDGLARDHTNRNVSNNLKVYEIVIPRTANRIRVIYDNTFDTGGSDIVTSARISKMRGR